MKGHANDAASRVVVREKRSFGIQLPLSNENAQLYQYALEAAATICNSVNAFAESGGRFTHHGESK